MARINIEESIWIDPRFLKLCVKLGDQFRAVGMVVMAWRLAQEFWCPSKRMIPKRRWADAELPDLLFECGLAELQGDEVYVRGTAESFSWYFDRIDSGRRGGKASAEKRKTKSKQRSTGGQPTLEQPLSNPQPTLEQPSTKSKQIQPSLSLSSSSSSSLSSSESSNYTKNENETEDAGEGENPVREFIGLYCELWKSRYKTNPEMGGKPAGVAKRLVKNLGIRRARELVYAYLEMNDIWFIQQRHDLTTLESKLSAVVIYADTGATVTQGELRQADKTQTNRNVWDSLKAPVGGANGK